METRKQIKDFKIALKDLEPLVKDPKWLLNGRNISNFSLRPREAWANWLLCIALREINGFDITFAEDEWGDGIILERGSGNWIMTEHVAAMDFPEDDSLPQGEERVLGAIRHKIAKGPDYAKGKFLVVFLDGAGVWYPNKVGRAIDGTHAFSAVFCVALLSSGDSGYSYSVTQFFKNHSPTYRIDINDAFTDWKISRVQ